MLARSLAASAKHLETNGQRRPEQRSAPTASSAQSASGRLDLELGAVAGLGLVEPGLHRLPRPPVAPLGHQERLEALQLPAAEVVLPPLQHGDVDGRPTAAAATARPSPSSCSWSAFVAVATTTRCPDSSAGTR